MKSFFSRCNDFIARGILVAQVKNLPVASSGIDIDGDPFVQLDNGVTFYGYQSKRFNFFYSLLPSSVKAKLQFECIQVACDIVIRYYYGGLKYLGPKKFAHYTPKDGDTVAEIGAYQGFHCLRIANLIGSNGRLICIEPDIENYRLLKKNVDFNFPNHKILCLNNALSSSPGKISMIRKIDDLQSSSEKLNYSNSSASMAYEVEANSLDYFLAEILGIVSLDMLILQLNGSELDALKGLTKVKPLHLAIAARYSTNEVTNIDRLPTQIVQYLGSRNYSASIVESDYVFARLKNAH